MKDIHVSSVELSCFACPTVFDMKTTDGDPIYFRLRHGSFRLAYDDREEIIVSGTSGDPDIDGVCTFDEMVEMLQKEGINLVMGGYGDMD